MSKDGKNVFAKMIEKQGRNDYYWSNEEYTHATRSRVMLKKYGKEIKKLYGHDPWIWRILTPFILLQLYLGYRASEMSWTTFLLLSYFVGGTITHSSFLAIHEVTHYLAFKTRIYNDFYAIFINLIVPFPYAMMFKTYHSDHHHYLGWELVDVDVPTVVEGKLLSNFLGKFFFLTFQILFYAFRPTIIRRIKFDNMHIINYVVQLTFNFLVYSLFGFAPLLYFLFSIFLGTSWHPISGHFISEHFVFKGDGKQETFSYYGPLNWLTWNAGYHVEHHDFPSIPWNRLQKLRDIAPEFYDDLIVTESWPGTLFDFLFDTTVNQFSRVVREKGAAQREKLLPTLHGSVERG
ncbi:putative fatty acid desaturase, putative,sphingolipid delta 4 desaturase [Trypanosoma theileri]|uniref:sphingolipid 4-desaturase n=1 Tax=Trypanosoma theileri TaxID=67003 RepID=A0A1X0P7H0_9TRYP|nr:putative fatty acid desaturase, putative,sphingolipid delta 4 desaturase [Trypanosoma theileri]ORC92897.1 putative fatty acid desaturase, putative,sphingolipid delta 4 desaturase [Trypanosoma theileri]